MEKITADIFVETVYPGVNVGCLVASEGSVCIDTPLLPGEAQRWRALIRSLKGEPVRFVVYTNGQRERILGTQYLVRDRQIPPVQQVLRTRRGPRPRLTAGGMLNQSPVTDTGTVVAHKLAWAQVRDHCTDNFKQSMIDMLKERDPDIINLDVILPKITLDESIKLHVGDKIVTLLAVAANMLWVWLPEQGVLFTGDTVVVGAHPPLTVTDTQGWLAALERLRQEQQFQGVVIVPGRGPLCDISATEPLTKYLHVARDKTQQVYRAGRPKADLNGVAADLLPLYPVADGQRDRVQRQIKAGLDDLYDEFKAADAVPA